MPRNYDVVKIDPSAAPDDPHIPPTEEETGSANRVLPVILGGLALLIVVCVVGAFMVSGSRANDAPPDTQTPFHPPIFQLVTITHSEIPTATATSTVAPLAPAETPDLERTAVFATAINRPAASGPSENYRILVGSVLLQPGCNVTNIGFDASGARYYLHLPPSLIISVNPDLQLAEIRGLITHLDTCIYPLIQVESFVWLNQLATPAPFVTSTITNTVWRDPTTPTPTIIYHSRPATLSPPTFTPTITHTATPVATYTPYPTYTPYYIPSQRQWPTPEPWPTHTPYPTNTPYPTYTIVPTPTDTPTLTPTPTITPTDTPTLTPTPTDIPTLTPTPTFTPTDTPIPSPTPTPTPTPTATLTATVIITP